MVSSSETKSPRPHEGLAPGHRQWNSSGKAADIAGGPCPGPGSACKRRPAPAGDSPGESGAVLRLVQLGHPARFSQRGVNGSWVVPHRPARVGWGWGRECVFTQTALSTLLFPDTSERIRTSQPGHVWSNVKGSSGSQSSPGQPRLPRIPDCQLVPRETAGSGNLLSGW